VAATQISSSNIRLSDAYPPPVLMWAVVGGLILLFQFYVLGKWITGPYFVATDPGPDPISKGQQFYFLFLQVAVPLLALWMLWQYLIKPWRRQGGITTDGRLIGAFFMIFFWDMGMNFSSTVLFYNSYFFNRGAWNLGSWPLWYSPDANALPEPIFVTVPGYTALVFSQALFICWLLRKVKARRPDMGFLGALGFVVIGLTIVDSAIEILLIHTGIYAYPGTIHAVTLFAGNQHQFPLTEGFLFGGLGVGATALLSFYRDDTGKTWAERGIERVKMGTAGKQWIRFLAVFGFIHFFFFTLYTLPNQFISLNTDPFPKGYPSYLENGMCVYGVNGNECPGPGVMMPRPPFNVVPGGLPRKGK
jgi:hypothetical protein